jgi:hypothetical protein
MDFSQRCYSGEADQALMAVLARKCMEEHLHVFDLPYRLSSWALDTSQNTCLWFDDKDRLVAWAVLQTPFWTIDIVCHPSIEQQLYHQILSWADSCAQAALHSSNGRPAWFVMVFAGQKQRIHDLEQAGFKCQADVGEDSWSKVLMLRSNDQPVRLYKAPAGFTVRSLSGEQEIEGYVALHQAVFESKNMTIGWRRRTLQHAGYRPELDILVEAPNEQLAAFCICWYDEQACLGQVEPLGCGRDYRQYALGRVALSEGLSRLQRLGAKHIYVETDNYRNTAFRLYQSFDFKVIQDVLVYRKDYEGV